MEDNQKIKQLLLELESFITDPNSKLNEVLIELEAKHGIEEPYSKFYLFEKLSLTIYPIEIKAFSPLKNDPEIHDYIKKRVQEIQSLAAKAVYYELIFQCMNNYKELIEAGKLYLDYLRWLIDKEHYERSSWILRRISIITGITKARNLIEEGFKIVKSNYDDFYCIQDLNRRFRIQRCFSNIPHLITDEITSFVIEKTEVLFLQIIDENIKHLEFVLPDYIEFLRVKKINLELTKNQKFYLEILKFLGVYFLLKGEGGKSSHYFERAIKIASDFGFTNEIKKLNTSLTEASEKIQWIETITDVKFDGKSLLEGFEDVALKFFKNNDYPHLELFSIQFCNIPSIENLIDNIENDTKKGVGVWRSVFPTKKYSEGLPRDHFDQTTGEDLEKRAREELVKWTLLSTASHNCVFKLLKERGEITISKINDFLSLKLDMKEEDLAFIFYGMELHFKEDFIGSIHVLLPQIENLARKLIFEKYPTLLKHKIGESGIETYHMIFNILRTEEALQIFNKSFLDFLNANLYDPKHRNTRNRFLHGFASIDECSEDLSFFLIWIILMICKNNEYNKDRPKESHIID